MSIKEDSIIKNYLRKVKVIEKHNKSYYDKDSPSVSDHKYDKLKHETLELENKYSFLNHFNINSLEDLPNSDELMAAGLIDSRVDSSIFGTSKFVESEKNENKENIYSNIDDMISDTLTEDK